MKAVPVFFAPDFDTSWNASPGALTTMNAFAPLQLGAYGSIGNSNYISASLTGTDNLAAYMFRKIDGTVRFLTGRVSNIDEYDSSGTRTNQGTGYSGSTASWNMCAFGNVVVAVNYFDAMQVSTGTTFGAMGGGSPKARLIASMGDFIMAADYDDGTNQYGDGWWSCALGNYASWTPSAATQAANGRLLAAPGQIKALVPFHDSFVAFKDNAMFIGDYIGPPVMWAWRLLSNRIGCVGARAVTELDGKLYFLHTSGFYEFDGSSFNRIGLSVFQSFCSELGYTSSALGIQPSGVLNVANFNGTQCSADDIEGVVCFNANTSTNITTLARDLCYFYNARSQKWGRDLRGVSSNSADRGGTSVRTTTADAQAFKNDTGARLWFVFNDTAGTKIKSTKYPAVTTDAVPSTYTTGLLGDAGGSETIVGVYHRTLPGTDDDSGITATLNGYTSENKNKTNGTATGAVNTTFDSIDVTINSKFRDITETWSVGKKVILAGVAPVFAKAPTRP